MPFHKIASRTWLYNRPKQDVYKLLIDCYRLRMNDDFNFQYKVENESIYGSAPNPIESFKRFLGLVKEEDLFPPWWSEEMMSECLDFGSTDSWSSLTTRINKHTLLEHYVHPFMDAQLRIFSQQVYGTGPGGMDTRKVFEIQLLEEQADVYTLPRDVSNMIPQAVQSRNKAEEMFPGVPQVFSIPRDGR
ncbi:hypothetical protein BGZ46_003748 [Entomortierella lignicola]|nr:hypothetical protein BGZ46_003748 [Entomortierella lignicola]